MSSNVEIKLDPTTDIIADIKAGRMVVLVDDEDRENEGDLIIASDAVTPEAVNFMVTHARGLVCMSMTGVRANQLGLDLMAKRNDAPLGTAFTVSIEAREGVTTGISAFDRAKTIRTAIDSKAKPEDLVQPGHVFPLIAKEGGVLVRTGHTEASVDLARLAGREPSGVICEIMNEDGTMARLPQLREFCDRHGLKLGTIADLVEHRLQNESLVSRRIEADLPSRYGGDFHAVVYNTHLDKSNHVALVKGRWDEDETVLVRVHTRSIANDIFGAVKGDRQVPVPATMKAIDKMGKGVLLYLRPEGQDDEIVHRLEMLAAEQRGEPRPGRRPSPTGFKDFGIGAQILRDLKVRKLKLLTNNPKKIVALAGYGLEIVEQVAPSELGLDLDSDELVP